MTQKLVNLLDEEKTLYETLCSQGTLSGSESESRLGDGFEWYEYTGDLYQVRFRAGKLISIGKVPPGAP